MPRSLGSTHGIWGHGGISLSVRQTRCWCLSRPSPFVIGQMTANVEVLPFIGSGQRCCIARLSPERVASCAAVPQNTRSPTRCVRPSLSLPFISRPHSPKRSGYLHAANTPPYLSATRPICRNPFPSPHLSSASRFGPPKIDPTTDPDHARRRDSRARWPGIKPVGLTP